MLTPFESKLVALIHEYGHSPDAIIQRREHRDRFFDLVRSRINGTLENYDISLSVENIRKKCPATKGVFAEEKVLMLPPQHDKMLLELKRMYLEFNGITEKDLVHKDKHRARFVRIFNGNSDAGWSEDQVIVRLVQLRKKGS